MEEAGTELETVMRVCLQLSGGPSHCNLALRITEEVGDPDYYQITANPPAEFQCPSGLWVTANLESEGQPEVEIEHDQG